MTRATPWLPAAAATLALGALACSTDIADISYRPCALASDCPSGQVCGATGHCTIECREDRDCRAIDAALVCARNSCIDIKDPKLGEVRGDGGTSDRPDGGGGVGGTGDGGGGGSPDGGGEPDGGLDPSVPAPVITRFEAAGAPERVILRQVVALQADATGADRLTLSVLPAPGTQRATGTGRWEWTLASAYGAFPSTRFTFRVVASGRGGTAMRELELTMRGNVLACDRNTGAVVALGSDGSDQGEIVARGTTSSSYGCARLANGDLAILSASMKRVLRFQADGAAAGTFDATTLAGDIILEAPSSIAVLRGGDVLVGDDGNHSVQRFSADGRHLGRFADLGHYGRPVSILEQSSGTVLVSDAFENDVLKYAADGTPLGTFTTGLRVPGPLVEAPGGDVLLAINGSDDEAIWRYSAQGGRKGMVVELPWNTSVNDLKMWGDVVLFTTRFSERVSMLSLDGGEPVEWSARLENASWDLGGLIPLE